MSFVSLKDLGDGLSFVRSQGCYISKAFTRSSLSIAMTVPAYAWPARINEPCVRAMVRKRDKKMIRETLFEPRTPTDLWAPIVDATADLLTETESSRIRFTTA